MFALLPVVLRVNRSNDEGHAVRTSMSWLRAIVAGSIGCVLLVFAPAVQAKDPITASAQAVLKRTLGPRNAERFDLLYEPGQADTDSFHLQQSRGRILVSGTSAIALTRGAYDYLKQDASGMVTWSGQRIVLPVDLPAADRTGASPYRYRYYFNVVTHGYSTPYWDWPRWEREIDWMALHGINMPLIGGAHEAILARVFRKLGLSQAETAAYFSGPAHLPWNRMGNLQGFDGPPPASYNAKQIALTHKMLARMRELGMHPIVPAFAGFVPPAIKRVYPQDNIRRLGWGGGLPPQNDGYILSPSSPLFLTIGKLYIREWEAEFGKAEFYLADSFNEMDVPLAADPKQAQDELASYGEAVYRSIHEAAPQATWVMQGWTFPYHKDAKGKLFWTPERLHALVSRVPDDRLLILDLANEYNRAFWKIDPSWKMYDGFFGKQWVYSFIPNMGGKTPLNGRLDLYATMPAEALQYERKGNLVGFGFAPEGIENNEIVYELLSDVAWTKEPIDLDTWIAAYCRQRYGVYPESLKTAYGLLRRSAFGSFTDHPIHRFQLRPYTRPEGVEDHATVHRSDTFNAAVVAFLADGAAMKKNALYRYDAIDLTAQYLGLVADDLLRAAAAADARGETADLAEASAILTAMDRLLASHPDRRLGTWVEAARRWGDTPSERAYYAANARRLLTTWGGDPVNDYAGRVWNGLIGSYYLPRWTTYHGDHAAGRKERLRQWEERWIHSESPPPAAPFADPVAEAQELIKRYPPQANKAGAK